jgi:hypothetical protein
MCRLYIYIYIYSTNTCEWKLPNFVKIIIELHTSLAPWQLAIWPMYHVRWLEKALSTAHEVGYWHKVMEHPVYTIQGLNRITSAVQLFCFVCVCMVCVCVWCVYGVCVCVWCVCCVCETICCEVGTTACINRRNFVWRHQLHQRTGSVAY